MLHTVSSNDLFVHLPNWSPVPPIITYVDASQPMRSIFCQRNPGTESNQTNTERYSHLEAVYSGEFRSSVDQGHPCAMETVGVKKLNGAFCDVVRRHDKCIL